MYASPPMPDAWTMVAWPAGLALVAAGLANAVLPARPHGPPPPDAIPSPVAFVKDYGRRLAVLVDDGAGDSSVLEHYWLPKGTVVEGRLPVGCRIVTWPDDAAFVEACRAAGVAAGGRGVYAYRRLFYDGVART